MKTKRKKKQAKIGQPFFKEIALNYYFKNFHIDSPHLKINKKHKRATSKEQVMTKAIKTKKTQWGHQVYKILKISPLKRK